jgi:hypothetical protein
MDRSRIALVALCLIVVFGVTLSAQEPPAAALVAQLMKAPGTLLGAGHNTRPAGPFKLVSYRVHELALAQPVTVTVNGKTIVVDRAWRLTITGGPFAPRAIPAVIEIDGAAAGVALESADESELRLVTFDPSALRDGARVTVSYGELRSDLPEPLHVNR